MMYFIIGCFIVGLLLTIWLGLNNVNLEDKIRAIPNPVVQQMTWSHYETWRNENLPMSVRQAAIQSVYSAIAQYQE